MNDIDYMKEAYKEAKIAYTLNEVPIGCIIIHEDKIIGRGHNRRATEKNVLHHAEIIAIDQACKHLNDWRLDNCKLYVTVEPCPMCTGAILQARIPQVIYGTPNPKAGCAGSVYNLLNEPKFNHQSQVTAGIYAQESAALMKKFFTRFRKNLGTLPQTPLLF